MNIYDAITRDCFNHIIALHDAAAATQADTAAMHQDLQAALDRALGRALAGGVPVEDAYAMIYALAALADSTALRGRGPVAAYWREHLLNVHYFADSNAQDGFYERLEQARKMGRAEVVQVYAVCMALGFRGRLRSADAERTQAQLLATVAHSRWQEGTASIFYFPSVWRLWHHPAWIGLGAAVLAVALYVLLGAAVRSDAGALVGSIDTLVHAR